jgi:hypothetical protein
MLGQASRVHARHMLLICGPAYLCAAFLGHRLVILPHGFYGSYADAIRGAVTAVHPNTFVGRLQPENGPETAASLDARCCGHGAAGGCGGGESYDAGHCTEAECPTTGLQSECSLAERPEETFFRMGNFVVGGFSPNDEPGTARGADEGSQIPTVVVYIGEEGAELTRLMLENASFRFLLFSTVGGTDGAIVPEDSLIDSARALKRRYYLMMKAKDAERIGIVVATTAVAGYSAMVQRLKRVIRAAGKRPYVFYVGKINPAKLANFAEMDALVLVASPETCAAVDVAEYWKPLITPMECEMALVKGRTWTGHYDFDFRPLLATSVPASGDGADGDENGEVTHSLTTGTVTVRSAGAIMAPSAGEVMMTQRTFKGLDLNEGLDRPLDLVQGRVGIASGYSHEPSARANQLSHTQVTDGVLVPAHMLGHATAVNYRIGAEVDGSICTLQGDGRDAAGAQLQDMGESVEEAVSDEREASGGRAGDAERLEAETPGASQGEMPSASTDDHEADMQRVAGDVDDFLALLAS